MSITRQQAVSANASSVAISTPTTGDLILTFAYNNASTTIPTLGSGFTSIDTASLTSNAMRVGYKISVGSETTSGTWTNATNVVCMVFRGTLPSGTPFGGHTPTTGTSATMSFGAVTMSQADGTSWVVGFVGAKSATAGMSGNTTNLTNETNQTTVAGKDSEGGLTSFSSQTYTVTTSGLFITEAVEILALDHPRTPTAGSATLAGGSESGKVVQGTVLTPTAGTLSLSGVSESGLVVQSTVEQPTAGSLTLTGGSSVINRGIVPGVASLSLTGGQPIQGFVITPQAGSLSLSGNAGSLVRGTVISTLSGGSGAFLSASGALSITTVDMTAEGTLDWIHTPSTTERKLTGGSQIGFSLVGSTGSAVYGNDPRTVTWSDGSPDASGSTSGGRYNDTGGIGNGFQLTLPADTTPRRAKIYVGGYQSSSKFTASLSDSSASPYTDTSYSNFSDQYNPDPVYTIDYAAASAGQTLTVQWLMNNAGSGNVTLQGATLATSSMTGSVGLSIVGGAPSLILGTVIRPSAGSLSLTGATPTIATTVSPSAGALTLTGVAPAVVQGRPITPQSGALTLSGNVPIDVAGTVITPSSGSLAITGVAGSAVQGTLRTPVAGSLSLTGASSVLGFSILPSAGSLTLTGFAPTDLAATLITPSSGSLSIVGSQSLPVQGTLRTPQVGSLSLAGQAGSAVQSTVRTPVAGSLTMTGASSTLGFSLIPGAGSLTLTGAAPVVTTGGNHVVTPLSGSLSLSGVAGSTLTNFFRQPQVGSLAITGNQAVTRTQTFLTPGTGSLTITGQSPVESIDTELTPATGQLTLTGGVPTYTIGSGLTVRPIGGSLVLNGVAPSLSQGQIRLPQSGSMSLVGGAPVLIVTHHGLPTPTRNTTLKTYPGQFPNPPVDTPVPVRTITIVAKS